MEILQEWIDAVLTTVLQMDTKSLSSEESIIVIWKSILSSSSLENEVDEEYIYDYIKENYDVNLQEIDSADRTLKMIEYCLMSAISSSCPYQANHIQTILSLDVSSQSYLMKIIQNQGQNQGQNQSEEKVKSEINSGEIENEVNIPNNIPQCYMCDSKSEMIQNQLKTINMMNQREQELEIKFKSELAMNMNKLIDAEVLILEKDQKISNLSERLEITLTQLTDLEEKAKLQKDYSAKLVCLQDRIDILQPQAEKVESLETQINRLRDKLDSQAGLKQQLKDELSSHSETHNKLIAAETELETTRKYKPLLDDYRNKHAESSIRIESLQLRLKQLDEEVLRLNNVLFNLSDNEGTGYLQAQQLAEELKETSEKLRVLECGNGIGEGITELNPTLMNELNSLRIQNADLLSKLDATSLQALDRLLNEVEEQKCVNTSLNSKWLSTSDELTTARQLIEKLHTELFRSKNYEINLEQRIQDIENMAIEHVQSLQMEHNEYIQILTDQHNKSMMDITNEKNIVIEQLTSDLEDIQSKLKCTEDDLNEIKDERDDLETEVDQLTKTIENGKLKLKSMMKEYEELKVKSEQVIKEEETKVNLITAELDTERTKRRRTDREKKLLEAEVHRSKTQVQISGLLGSNQEVEIALKEFRTMQSQLEETQLELTHLRTILNNNGNSSEVEGANYIINDGNAISGEGEGHRENPRRGATRLQGPKRNLNGFIIGRHHDGSHVLESGILQQNELSEKRIDQMQKEKREMIARNLEENKEKLEISQQLLQCEKEIKILKEKVTKLTLENERLQRQFAKSTSIIITTNCFNEGGTMSYDKKENHINY